MFFTRHRITHKSRKGGPLIWSSTTPDFLRLEVGIYTKPVKDGKGDLCGDGEGVRRWSFGARTLSRE